MNYPSGVAQVDKAGNLYIADARNNRALRKVDTSGPVTTVAGNGTELGYGGDGGLATSAELNYPANVKTFDASGSLYFADDGNHAESAR